MLSCGNGNDTDTLQQATLEHLEEKHLTVALESNSTDYFLYRGLPMGYHLELLESFAQYLDCQLTIVQGKSLSEQLDLLKKGEIDLIASNLNVSPLRERFVSFSKPLYTTRQVLVQLRPEYLNDSSDFVSEAEDLRGKRVHVRKNSVFEIDLKARNREFPRRDRIRIVRETETEEQLLLKASRGDIPYTVVSECKALKFANSHPQIDCHLVLSGPEPIAWAVRLNDDTLLSRINFWIDSVSQKPEWRYLYHKYYELPFERTVRSAEAGFRKMDSVSRERKKDQWELLVREGVLNSADSSFLKEKRIGFAGRRLPQTETTTVSPFDALLKKYSREIPWDWRLLASLIYQESQFQSHLVSKRGAIGLMQMMPSTAREYGITVSSSEEAQIKAGTDYIKRLYKILPDSIDPDEKIYFVLASYNIGPGHVLDAMRLAKKYGADPKIWSGNVETYLMLKSKPRYYKDPECRNGYAGGKETVDFVRKIERRYMHYCNLAP